MVFEGAGKLLLTQELFKASKEFSAAFDDTLVRLNPEEQQTPAGVLSETMPIHKVAYNKFRPIFQQAKGVEAVALLDKAWRKYYNTEKYGDTPFTAYARQKFEGSAEEAKKVATNRIQNLLDIAKP